MTSPGDNAKVAPDGSWTPFRGWSILFDQVDGIFVDREVPTAGDVPAPEHETLSARLAATLTESHSPLAVLPASTHHVTVCDGVNPAVLQRSGDHRGVGLVDGPMPEVLHEPIQDVIDAAADGLTLEVGRIELRNSALVLALEPTGAHRARAKELERRRHRLLIVLGRLLGLEMTTQWRPHITLAYRHHPTGGFGVQAVDRLLEQLRAEHPLVTAAGAGLYRFDSMVSFRRDLAWQGTR